MSGDRDHGATTIHSKDGGGGAGKWLLGGLAAAVLLGGGYFAWKSMTPQQSDMELAYTDQYADDAVGPGAVEPGQSSNADAVAADEPVGEPAASETRSAPVRRAATPATPATAAAVPEETIGITPISATTEASATTQDSDEVFVTAPRRPVWASIPSDQRLAALYPARARERGREGEARLACTVLDGGALDCARVEETSGSFGYAAMRVADTLRHSRTRADGSNAVGSPVNLRVVFRLEEEEPQRFASR